MLKRGLVIPAIAVLSFLYMSWHVLSTTKANPVVEPPSPPSRSPYGSVLAGNGLIEPRYENLQIAAHVAGIVQSVDVQVGATVHKDDLLFRLDDRLRRSNVAIQQAMVDLAQSQLNRLLAMPRKEDLPPLEAKVRQMRSQLTWEQDLLSRTEGLTSRNVTTEQDLVQRRQMFAAKKAELEVAEADLERLKAGAWAADVEVAKVQLNLAMGQLAQAKVELDRLEVRSPIDGTILKLDVRVGEFVGAPSTKTLLVLGDLSRYHVRVDIDENDLPRFRPGLPGKAFVRGDADNPMGLNFVRVDPFTEPKRSLTGRGDERVDTRILQAIYAIDPGLRTIYVGQQVDVFLDVSTPAKSSD